MLGPSTETIGPGRNGSNPRDHDDAARILYAWQMTYMDELVRRGERC
jgi:hypothetical protein